MNRPLFLSFCSAAIVAIALASPAAAAQPAETLFPKTTTLFVSVPDVKTLATSWQKTQFGQLLADPILKPFTEDVRRQLDTKWKQAVARIGVTIDDLKGVPSGELAIAVIKPGEKQGAVALMVDVTGHLDEAKTLLAKVDQNLKQEKAVASPKTVQGVAMATYSLPKLEGEAASRQVVLFINNNVLIATDSMSVATDILSRFSGQPTNALVANTNYQAIKTQIGSISNGLAPEICWFVEPFPLVESLRALEPPLKRKKGKDLVKIFREQGFDAIQGAGGVLNFAVEGRFEILHRTVVHAPAVAGAAAGEKYRMAARALRFLNQDDTNLTPQEWAPRELATYSTLHIDAAKSFDHAKSLIDAFIGDEGVVDDVLAGIKEDPNGPQVDIRKDLVENLGTRATMITDFELPITTKSERLIFAVETKDASAVAQVIDKIMGSDPDAREREFHGHKIWEIVKGDSDSLPQLQLEGPQGGDALFDPLAGGAAPPRDANHDDKKRVMPNSAVCVAEGHLFVASHIDFMKKVLAKAERRETLAGSADFRLVQDELNKLVADKTAIRTFSRTDEEYRGAYELIRQNKMPEAETLVGQLVNFVMSDGKEGEVRKQKLDGKKLPDYEAIRRYFGPGGMAVETTDTGWVISGVNLSKGTP